MRRLASLVLPLIGLVIFAWIIRGIGVGTIIDAFRAIDPKRLAVFPLFTAYFALVRGLRWQLIMRIIGLDYSLWRSTMLWAIGCFAGAVTPAKIGDAMRAYYLSRDSEHSVGECFLTIFIDRLMDVVTILGFGAITMLVFSYTYINLPSVWIVVLSVVVVFVFIYLMFHRDLMERLTRPVFRALIPKRYQDELAAQFHSFYDALGIYARERKRMLLAYILALMYWVGVILLAYAVAWVLNIDVSLGYLFLIMPMVVLIELIPITIAGLGTRDMIMIYFFSVVGIASAQAVTFSITYLVAGTFLTAVLGFIAWILKPTKLKEKLDGSEGSR